METGQSSLAGRCVLTQSIKPVLIDQKVCLAVSQRAEKVRETYGVIPFWPLGRGSVPPPGQCQDIIRHPWAFGSCFPVCAFGSSKLQLIPLATLFLNDITFSISLPAQCPLPEHCLPADLHHPDMLWIPRIKGLSVGHLRSAQHRAQVPPVPPHGDPMP